MKIIDFEVKGNVVRFALGADECDDYWGDDWDDRPYEHNAGSVYDRYVTGYAEILFPFDYTVLTPEDDWTYQSNSPFCKEDFKKRKAPCVVVSHNEDDWDARYSKEALNSNALKFYFEDKLAPGIYYFDKNVMIPLKLVKISVEK